MSRARLSGPGLTVACAVAGGALAMLTATGLSALAKPSDYAARRAALEQQIDQIERLQNTPRSGATYPKGAVCRGGLDQGAKQVEQALRAAAGSEVMVSNLVIEDLPQADAPGLRAARVRFEAVGGYGQTVALLSALGPLRPVVFADQVDLTSNTTAVTLQFSGRYYCSTSARL